MSLCHSNRFRELDGKENAAKMLIDSMRKESKYKTIPILIYCNTVKLAKPLENHKTKVFVSDVAADVVLFLKDKL